MTDCGASCACRAALSLLCVLSFCHGAGVPDLATVADILELKAMEFDARKEESLRIRDGQEIHLLCAHPGGEPKLAFIGTFRRQSGPLTLVLQGFARIATNDAKIYVRHGNITFIESIAALLPKGPDGRFAIHGDAEGDSGVIYPGKLEWCDDTLVLCYRPSVILRKEDIRFDSRTCYYVGIRFTRPIGGN